MIVALAAHGGRQQRREDDGADRGMRGERDGERADANAHEAGGRQVEAHDRAIGAKRGGEMVGTGIADGVGGDHERLGLSAGLERSGDGRG